MGQAFRHSGHHARIQGWGCITANDALSTIKYWIPACAGMTCGGMDFGMRWNDVR